jgi:uncharacterized protein YigA (DUF484 family)
VANAHSKDSTLFDKRITHRQIKDGRITHKELEARIKALPDMADASENIAERVFKLTDSAPGDSKES